MPRRNLLVACGLGNRDQGCLVGELLPWLSRQLKRVLGRIWWGVFKRHSRSLRKGYQQEEIRIINDYFVCGWSLLGDRGNEPMCKFLFSKCFAATVFYWENSASKSYVYRIGNDRVEGALGFYCVTTGQITLFEDDVYSDCDIELVIAASAICSILYGHEFRPEQLQCVLDEIEK